jgi:hypothetical protein
MTYAHSLISQESLGWFAEGSDTYAIKYRSFLTTCLEPVSGEKSVPPFADCIFSAAESAGNAGAHKITL